MTFLEYIYVSISLNIMKNQFMPYDAYSKLTVIFILIFLFKFIRYQKTIAIYNYTCIYKLK